MNKILNARFFSLLAEPSQEKVTNNEMQNAYGHFMEHVGIVSQSENNFSEIYRMLNNTRVELVFIESLYWYGQGKMP